MQKLLTPMPAGEQLVSPKGNPVKSDRVMALNKWVHHLSASAPREITLTGMGRPTFPVNEKLTNAEMGYWGSLAEKATEARREIKKYERSVKNGKSEKSGYKTDHKVSSPETQPLSVTKINGSESKLKSIAKKAFRLPFDILKRLRSNGYAAVQYTAPSGDSESRQVIAEGLSRFYGLEGDEVIGPEDVLFTVGGSSALYTIFEVINNNHPDGRIITSNPFYSLHAGPQHTNRLHTIDVMKLPGYRLTAEALKAEIAIAKDRAKLDGGKISAFVFSYPNNPTGQVLSRKEWEDIAQVLRENPDIADTPIVLDEAYAELQLDGNEHVSLFQVAPDLRQRIQLIRCGTKGLSAAGERMGVVVCKDRNFLEQLEGVQTEIYGHASKSSCHAYAAALDELSEGEQQRLVAWYGPMVDCVVDGLKTIGADMPDKTYQVNGTFYVMADLSEFIGTSIVPDAQRALPGVTTIMNDEHLAYHLLFKEQIMVAPLSYFGVNPKLGFVRITCSDVKHVGDLINRLGDALKKLREEKCDSLHPKISERLNQLNHISPEEAAKLVRDFNELGLGSFKITQESFTYSPAELSVLELKILHQQLHDLHLTTGAALKKLTPGGKTEAANKIKNLFKKNVTQKKSQRFFRQVDIMWCHWVDNFIDEKDRSAMKKLPPMDYIKQYPKWGLFYKALHTEFVKKGYDSADKAKKFDIEKFSKNVIDCVKVADKAHLASLDAKLNVALSRSSSEYSEDVQSSDSLGSARHQPADVNRSNPATSEEGSSLSVSPTEDKLDGIVLAAVVKEMKKSQGGSCGNVEKVESLLDPQIVTLGKY